MSLQRPALDWFVEPPGVTIRLLAAESFEGHIHDPCCGQGNIVRSLLVSGHDATGSDVVDRALSPPWFLGEADFLHGPYGLFGAPNCIFNPPFFRAAGAQACIRRALREATGKVAAFVESRFVAGGKRARGLYTEFPPSVVYSIADRPSCPPGELLASGEIEAKGGKQDYVWIVWDRSDPAPDTRHRWLK